MHIYTHTHTHAYDIKELPLSAMVISYAEHVQVSFIFFILAMPPKWPPMLFLPLSGTHTLCSPLPQCNRVTLSDNRMQQKRWYVTSC